MSDTKEHTVDKEALGYLNEIIGIGTKLVFSFRDEFDPNYIVAMSKYRAIFAVISSITNCINYQKRSELLSSRRKDIQIGLDKLEKFLLYCILKKDTYV